MKSTRYHYAVRWPIGIATSANTGRPIRTVHRFRSREQRDEWLSQGGDFRNGNNYREAVSRNEVASEIRRSAAQSPHQNGNPVWETGEIDGDILL